MPVALTHVGEAVVSKMIDSMRFKFSELCGLADQVDGNFLEDQSKQIVRTNVNLAAYGGRVFDGASCVDLVFRVNENLGIPIELKLGETRLTKSRIDEEWLSGCEASHKGERWKGNMMSVLERKFPQSTQPDALKARFDGVEVPLTKEWFIIARAKVIDSWNGSARPDFSSNVHLISFDVIVEKFGGEERFNQMVRDLLDFDYYSAWVEHE